MVRYAIRLQWKVRGLGRLSFSYVRPEYAENTLDGAELFDSLESAENEAHKHIEYLKTAGLKSADAKIIIVEV
jgi:hypothetical protein